MLKFLVSTSLFVCVGLLIGSVSCGAEQPGWNTGEIVVAQPIPCRREGEACVGSCPTGNGCYRVAVGSDWGCGCAPAQDLCFENAAGDCEGVCDVSVGKKCVHLTTGECGCGGNHCEDQPCLQNGQVACKGSCSVPKSLCTLASDRPEGCSLTVDSNGRAICSCPCDPEQHTCADETDGLVAYAQGELEFKWGHSSCTEDEIRGETYCEAVQAQCRQKLAQLCEEEGRQRNVSLQLVAKSVNAGQCVTNDKGRRSIPTPEASFSPVISPSLAIVRAIASTTPSIQACVATCTGICCKSEKIYSARIVASPSPRPSDQPSAVVTASPVTPRVSPTVTGTPRGRYNPL